MIVRVSYKVNLLALGLVCNHYVTDVLCLSNVALLRDSVALQKESFPNKHCTCRTNQKSAWIQSRTHCACMKKVRHVLRETASFPMTSKRDSGERSWAPDSRLEMRYFPTPDVMYHSQDFVRHGPV